MQHSNTIVYCATTGNDGQITPSRRFATLLLLLRRIMLTGLLWRQTELFLWCSFAPSIQFLCPAAFRISVASEDNAFSAFALKI